MIDHLVFIFYILFIIFSTIGYGYFFSYVINKNFLNLDIGYQGLFGFFTLIIISILTSFLTFHGYYHNIFIHTIGVLSFVFFLSKKNINFNAKLFFILFLILFISLYVYKNHDDFSYYHLTYALNLSENKFIIGTGNFGHGFRTFSSIFYFHSLLYLPYIEFYLFHSGSFLILFFFNLILIKKFFNYLKIKKTFFNFFFVLFSITFVNIVFYRIAEHGTDRSAQILIFLCFVLLLELIGEKIKFNNKKNKIEIIFIIIILASSFKAIYYIYLIIIPYTFYKFVFQKKYLSKINLRLIFILGLSLFLNISVNFLNTGCLLYPASNTCFETKWSIPKSEVKLMNSHYEWWAKAGGGAGYKVDMKKEDYIKNFVWVNNWVKTYFFNKVSDTLFGIIFICFLYYILFKYYCKQKKKIYKKVSKNNLKPIYAILFIFLISWFLKHPALRYGGYVLISLPFFIFFSEKIARYKYNFTKVKTMSYLLIFLIFFVFISRNIVRLDKEIKFYKYDLLSSPFFYVDNVESQILRADKNFTLYTTKDNKSCWASKTPCTLWKNNNFIKFFNYYIIYRDTN